MMISLVFFVTCFLCQYAFQHIEQLRFWSRILRCLLLFAGYK